MEISSKLNLDSSKLIEGQFLAQTAQSCLNSIIETTQHSVIEVEALRYQYAEVAILYSDTLCELICRPKPPEQEIQRRHLRR